LVEYSIYTITSESLFYIDILKCFIYIELGFRSNNNKNNQKMIFIIGAPRSGTKLLRGLLNGHS